MSHRHVHTVTPDITPILNAIPSFAQCVEVPTHADNVAIVAQLENIDGTDITHNIYGYLRGLNNDAVELIASYNNLETITTQGIYSHFVFQAASQYRAIGVEYSIGTGSFNFQRVVMNVQ